uniref:Uncharacterized protein n=1 Tax=Ciona savignyi TaxID=51511 RepID=H2YKI7_CIOSA
KTVDNILTEEKRFQFVVEDKHKGATSASENIGESTFEESFASFLGIYFLPTIYCALVRQVILGSGNIPLTVSYVPKYAAL